MGESQITTVCRKVAAVERPRVAGFAGLDLTLPHFIVELLTPNIRFPLKFIFKKSSNVKTHFVTFDHYFPIIFGRISSIGESGNALFLLGGS